MINYKMIKKIIQLLEEGKEVIITLAVGESYNLVGRKYSDVLISEYKDWYFVRKEWKWAPEARYLKSEGRNWVFDSSGRYIRIEKYEEALDTNLNNNG